MSNKKDEAPASEWLNPKDAPNNKIVWALIETYERDESLLRRFVSLASLNYGDWAGVQAWDEHPNSNYFSDYEWHVVGWQDLKAPNA